jgi:hypothetical protein
MAVIVTTTRTTDKVPIKIQLIKGCSGIRTSKSEGFAVPEKLQVFGFEDPALSAKEIRKNPAAGPDTSWGLADFKVSSTRFTTAVEGETGKGWSGVTTKASASEPSDHWA